MVTSRQVDLRTLISGGEVVVARVLARVSRPRIGSCGWWM